MNQNTEKTKLLVKADGGSYGGDTRSPPPRYENSPPELDPQADKNEEAEPGASTTVRPSGKVMGYLYDHRASIPGYGMIKMIQGVSIYALYVLFAMLLAYLLNQLDRYTLPIVTTSAGYDLQYGDKSCMKNRKLSEDVFADNNLTQFVPICTNETYFDWLYNMTINVKTNESFCETGNVLVFYSDTLNETINVCEYNYDGSGLLYQIVAGPVFNNLYPLAGFVTGFLADYGRRVVWLVISLFFWSAVTVVTGFAKTYWHLVLLRALLAIGAAGCTPFAVSLIGDYFPTEVRASAISVYYWGIYIGYSLAFAIGNGIEKVLNWRWVFFLSGIFGIVAAPIILLTVREPIRKTNPLAINTHNDKLPFTKRVLILLKTFILPGMFILCIAGGVRNAGGYVWAYNTELFFKKKGFSGDTISQFMSWIPLVGGSIGAVVGGVISDFLVKDRGPYMRVWVLIFSQLLAFPFATGALFLPYPWCFLTLIPANVFGEMWIGVATAIVVDLAPSKIRTASVALYLFIITIIGGNFNLLVSPIHNAFKQQFSDLRSYQWALFLTYPGVYAISSILFVLAFVFMRQDLKLKNRLERDMITIQNPSPKDTSEESEDKDKGEAHDKPV